MWPPSFSKIKFPIDTCWRWPFIHHVGCERYTVKIGVQKITDFVIKMPNSNRKTSESIKSTESSETPSTNFSSESDSSSATESSESGDWEWRQWFIEFVNVNFFKFLRIIFENYTFFTIFWANGILLSFSEFRDILPFSTLWESYVPT